MAREAGEFGDLFLYDTHTSVGGTDERQSHNKEIVSDSIMSDCAVMNDDHGRSSWIIVVPVPLFQDLIKLHLNYSF